MCNNESEVGVGWCWLGDGGDFSYSKSSLKSSVLYINGTLVINR